MTKPLVLVGEAWGAEEAKLGVPFVGSSGVELLRMLNESGIIEFTSTDRDYIQDFWNKGRASSIDAVWKLHPEIYRTNVFNIHPPGNKIEWFCGSKAVGIPGYPALIKSGYVHVEYQSQLERLGDELLSIDPNLVICLGNPALWALAGRTGITKLRGTTLTSTHTVSGFKLLPTYHPDAVLRQWELRPTTIADLMKASREKDYAEIRRPICELWIEPTIEDISTFIREHIYGSGHPLVSVDIETSGSRITAIGFAPRPSLGLVIPFDDSRSTSGSYWKTGADEKYVWTLIRNLLEDRDIPKLFQNGAYDISFLLRAYGIRVMNAKHDTMLLHHALHPEALKGLGYLGSVYSDHGSWKGMRKKNETIKRDD